MLPTCRSNAQPVATSSFILSGHFDVANLLSMFPLQGFPPAQAIRTTKHWTYSLTHKSRRASKPYFPYSRARSLRRLATSSLGGSMSRRWSASRRDERLQSGFVREKSIKPTVMASNAHQLVGFFSGAKRHRRLSQRV